MTKRIFLAVVIVGWCIVVTLWGDALAPHDPRTRTAVYRTDTTIVVPPFPVGTPGYPLGSDQFGRDILSRLIVGTRPTMIAVFLIAVLRVFLGLIIAIVGVTALPWIRRIVSITINMITAIPPFLGGLLVLALAGASPSLAVFILALTWNSWGDCARDIIHQLQRFRQQPYYFAAQSSGDTEYSIMVRHGARLISPLLGRILVRELSSALTALAMVGFLGYFVGGATWIIVAGDAVPIGARTSDYPELGQMLATSFERMLRPEYLFVVGSYIALIIVGLQLLMSVLDEMTPRHIHAIAAVHSTIEWFVARQSPVWLLIIPCLITVGFYRVLAPAYTVDQQDTRSAPLITDRVHPWGVYGADASQSFRIAQISALTDPIIVTSTVTITSAPILGQHGDVLAYTDQPGLSIWHTDHTQTKVALPFTPVGTPTFDQLGRVIVVSATGDIVHMDLYGRILMAYHTVTRAEATSHAVVGPNGQVAVTVVDRIELFDSTGLTVWASNAIAGYQETAPVFSPDGTLIMLANQAFDAADGGRLPLYAGDANAQFENPRLISGADGYIYRRTGHRLTQLTGTRFVPVDARVIDWDASNVTLFFPQLTGVTIRGVGWQLYQGNGSRAEFVWMYGGGRYTHMPISPRSTLLAVTDDATAVTCTAQRITALDAHTTQPIWAYTPAVTLGECLGGAFSDTDSVYAYSHGLIWQQQHQPSSP